MEIRAYFKIIGRFWWVIVLAVVATGGGAFLLTKIRAPVYSTSSRVLIHPASSVSSESARIDLIGQLGARYISGTYAQAFTADKVKAEARAKVGLLGTDPNQPAPDRAHDVANYALEANVLPDTVVVQVSGTGPDPQILAAYIDATVDASIENTRDLFADLELNRLEPASVPTKPISPQPSRDVPLGVGLGLAVGILLAMALDYLLGSTPVPVPAAPEAEPTAQPGFLRPPLRRVKQG